jgi:sec-independent protein translocase protein TatA
VPFGISIPELLLLLLAVLLLFGARRLPEMGRSLGRGMREFKDAVTGAGKDDERPELPPSREEEPAAAARARERDTY